MILSKTKKIVAVCMVVCIAGGVGLFFLFSYITTKGDAIIVTAQALVDYDAQSKENNALTKLLESTADDRATLAAAQLSEADTIEFLTEVERMAQQRGVVLTTDSLEIIEAKIGRELKVSFTIEGDEQSLQKMISVLETLPYASYVDTVSFQIVTAEDVAAEAKVVVKVLMTSL